ncbi:hypothetical protein U9M48_036935 [Paspalum notatum var. saurae]|uniref:Integrase catalytic domain-containing protein n=1 Tax=Paspalum notatum var. saurae TaxID=547442 RepID=A0AAQ3UI84_PASNO
MASTGSGEVKSEQGGDEQDPLHALVLQPQAEDLVWSGAWRGFWEPPSALPVRWWWFSALALSHLHQAQKGDRRTVPRLCIQTGFLLYLSHHGKPSPAATGGYSVIRDGVSLVWGGGGDDIKWSWWRWQRVTLFALRCDGGEFPKAALVAGTGFGGGETGFLGFTELRGFLGLTNYYRRFVKNYGCIAHPLTQLLWNKQFVWTESATQAFLTLKKAMITTPVLALPNFTLPFTVETDACGNGVGAVLMQQGQPIAFLSKGLGEKHRHLSIYEKEFLALIMAVEKWRPYLQRQPFTILTNHKSLSYLTEQTLHSDMQRKAMAWLMGLQFTIVYKQGKENTAADALSRVGHAFSLTTFSAVQPQWLQEVANSYMTDSHAQHLLARLALSSPDSAGYSLQNGLIYQHGRLWIGNNAALCTKIIAALHSSAIGTQVTYHRVKQHFVWSGLKQDIIDFTDSVILVNGLSMNCITLLPLPLPKVVRQDLSMGFIEGLPNSEGFTTIMVVVDQFTKELFKLYKVQLHLSTAYHPQIDGQTERVNQCLEMYLRCAVHDSPKH